MTAPALRWKLPGDEVEYIGPVGLIAVRRLPVLSLPWYEETLVDTPATAVLMGRNGRPRNPITLPGYGKGRKPGNHGRRFPPEPLTNAEALAVLAAIPLTQKTGVRNLALITLLWRTGLRVSEALDLKPHHIDFDNRRVTVLCGKGGKRRTVGIDMGGLAALQPWLIERAMLGIGNDSPLFCTVQLPGRGNRLNAAYVREVLHSYGRVAKVPKRVHPHGLRHTLACGLIREGFSLAHVSAQLGHSEMSTTCIYLRGLGADEAFEAVAGRQWPGLSKAIEDFAASKQNMELLEFIDDHDNPDRWSEPNGIADRADVGRRGIVNRLNQLERAGLAESQDVFDEAQPGRHLKAKPGRVWRVKCEGVS